MSAIEKPPSVCDLQAPRRNNYFHGKMLDAYHFQLESEYFIRHRRMLNRLVSGCGVVCGLDVRKCPKRENAVVVTPGLAIDCCGNEIIVDCPVPIAIDPAQYELVEEYGCDPEYFAHLVICYHECLSEPAPVLTGDCMEQDPCSPGVIRERYKILVHPGCAPPPPAAELLISDVISGGKLDYRTLAREVSKDCPPCPDDCCIPLANIRASEPESEDEELTPEEIDIAVRPIVYTNDLLYQMLLSLLSEEPSFRTKKGR